MKDLAWINLMKAIDSLFDKFTKEEKNDTYTFQGVVGIDRNVRVFVVPESSILNIICDKKETIEEVQQWCRDIEIKGRTATSMRIFDALGHYSIIINLYGV